jgi:single-strand DNA-binding protein
MNKAILLGRLTKAPEIKYTQSGKAVASFTLAVDRRKSARGDSQADFISCVAWDKVAEIIGNYCSKGQQIAVDGRIQSRSYEAKDGSKRYVTEVVVQNMYFCGRRGDNAGNGAAAAGSMEPAGEEIPF